MGVVIELGVRLGIVDVSLGIMPPFVETAVGVSKRLAHDAAARRRQRAEAVEGALARHPHALELRARQVDELRFAGSKAGIGAYRGPIEVKVQATASPITW